MKKKFGLLALTGVIALASCSQGNTPGVSQYKLTINVSGVPTAPVTYVKSGGASQTVNVAGSTTLTLDAGSYTVTPGAVTGFTASPSSTSADLSSSDKTITLTYTKTGTDPVIPVPGPGASITITSPATGATLPSNTATQVNFTTAGTLTGVTCSVNGGTAAPATVATNSGFCTVTTALVGSTTITVSGKDSAGATVNSTVVVQGTTANTFPTGVTFDPAQEIKVGADGTVDDTKNDATDITARVFTNNGWRQLGQGISTGGNPTTDTYTYVKGTVNISYAVPAGATKVEVLLARTTGSDVPTADDVQAADVLNVDVSAAGAARTVTTAFDSTKLGEFQAVPEWLVFRVNGGTPSFLRVVADNTAPQPARAEIEGAKVAGSNFIRNFRGVQNNNFVRGKLETFTSNRDLQDQPFGRAPVTSTVPQRRPAGFESIRYFLVPAAIVDVIPGLRDSDGVRLAKAIRFAFNNPASVPAGASGDRPAVIASAPQLSIGAAGDFRTLFDSTATTVCATGTTTTTTKVAGAVPDGKYRVYALTRDQIGNETASPEYQVVTFDNVGPNVSAIGLRDASPLPFPSTNPTRFISDVAEFGGGNIKDNGIGFDPTSPFVFNISSNGGNVALPVTPAVPVLVNGLINTITIPATTFDTNAVADGEQTASFNSFTDVLGNPPTNCAPFKVIIDNTDPTVSYNRITATGVVESGSPQSIETLASDATSGVYANILFWNDYAAANPNQEAPGRTRANGYVGAPVEIQRTYGELNPVVVNNTVNVGNNATWNALYPAPNDQGRQPININVLVSDRAGNATVLTRNIVVTPRVTNNPINTGLGGGLGVPFPFTIPTLGTSDGFRFDRSGNYAPTNSRFINALNANGTTLNDAGKPFLNPANPSEDAVLSLSVSGTVTPNGFVATTTGGTSTGYDKVNSVTGYGGFDRTDWGKVLTYLNTTPTAAQLNTFGLYDPSLLRQSDGSLGANSNLFQARVDTRFLNDGGIRQPLAAPWLKIGDLSTANQYYKVNSDLLNNLYWTRGYDSSTYDYLKSGLVPLAADYDEIAGVVTDTAGAYNFYGEKTK